MPGLTARHSGFSRPSWAEREAARKAKQAASWERMKQQAAARVNGAGA